jgi:hypothetical protein
VLLLYCAVFVSRCTGGDNLTIAFFQSRDRSLSIVVWLGFAAIGCSAAPVKLKQMSGRSPTVLALLLAVNVNGRSDSTVVAGFNGNLASVTSCFDSTSFDQQRWHQRCGTVVLARASVDIDAGS